MFGKIAQTMTRLATKHPRLLSVAVGFAITLAVGTAIGLLDPNHMPAAAATATNTNNGGNSAVGRCC